MESLHINGVLFSNATFNRGLVKLLTGTEFLHDTSLLKLSLELLQGALNVLAFFYRYYNHFLFLF